MKNTSRLLITVLLTGLVASPLAGAGWPPWLERWLFNATERTERAVESFEQGDVAAAIEPLEIALRLAQDESQVQYNAGVGRLGAGRDDSHALLEAVALSGGELVPLARYNLGNARLADDDYPGAIEAFQQALRIDPDFQDAKYNLELAQRRLEEQQQEQDSPEQPPQKQEQDSSGQAEQQQEQGEQDQEQPGQEPPGQEPPPDPSQNAHQTSHQDQPPRPSPLPQFRDLPDMTAQEAAAILEAIENMEREDRRREAIEAVEQHRSGKKDW